jgi:hypothetical protein
VVTHPVPPHPAGHPAQVVVYTGRNADGTPHSKELTP